MDGSRTGAVRGPDAFSNPARVAELRGGAPPDDIDPSDRLVFALYGEDPTATVAWAQRTLDVQHEVLEWQMLVRELGPDEDPSDLPRPSLEPSTEGAANAIQALEARAERLTRRDHDLRRSLDAHVERARELVAADDAAAGYPWQRTIADAGGLLAAIDAHLARQGDRSDTRKEIEVALARSSEALEAALLSVWSTMFFHRLATLWPRAALSEEGDPIRREATELSDDAARASDAATREALESRLSHLLERTAVHVPTRSTGSADDEREEGAAGGDGDAEDADAERFLPMSLADRAIERSVRELSTPAWGIQDGLRQVGYFNLSRGRRDLKMLRGTRDIEGPLWELRGHARNPVRVMYRLTASGPLVLAIFIKRSNEQQRRVIGQVLGWTGEQARHDETS